MKKLLPYLLILLWVGLVAAIGWGIYSAVQTARDWGRFEADTTRLFSQVEVDRILHDSTVALTKRSDAVTYTLLGVAERHRVTGARLQGVADSLLGVLDRSQTPSESLSTALHALDVHHAALGEALGEVVSLRGIVEVQSLALGRLKISEATAWGHIDSLQALIRRVPKGCRLLLIPCPRLVGGVGVTYSGGKVVAGPSVAFGWSW